MMNQGPPDSQRRLQGRGSAESLQALKGGSEEQRGAKGPLEGLVVPQATGTGAPREDIRTKTYRRLDSLEETIRELENTLMEIGAHPSSGPLSPVTPLAEKPSDSSTQSNLSPAESTGENKRPPVPPKPSVRPPYIQVHHSPRQTPASAHLITCLPCHSARSLLFEFSPDRWDTQTEQNFNHFWWGAR